jgi:hypothetical protein
MYDNKMMDKTAVNIESVVVTVLNVFRFAGCNKKSAVMQPATFHEPAEKRNDSVNRQH